MEDVSKPGAKVRHGWRMYLSLEPREDMVEDVSKPGAKGRHGWRMYLNLELKEDMGGGCI